MQLWIGTSGYVYPDWVGPFYPPRTLSSGMLTYYTKHFPLVELNFTFYRPPTPEALANHLAFLHIDLTDPDFHVLALEHSRVAHAEIRMLLDEAVSRGDLIPCDTERLARAVGSVMGGGLLSWAIVREGDAIEWLRRDLETLLAPYRKNSARKTKKTRHVRRHSTRRRGDHH